jgi:hypothetical protein
MNIEHKLLDGIFPSIYLFTLGTVKDLRQSMMIDPKYNDNMIVCKYGKAKNLEMVTSEHMANYKSIPNCNLTLKYYSYVDPKNIADAQNNIESFMNAINTHIEYKNHKRIIVLDPKILHNLISKQYSIVMQTYTGTVTDLSVKIKNLENELAIDKERTERLLIEKNYAILELTRELFDLGKDMRMEIRKLKK